MEIQLYNTLSRKKEILAPIHDGEVRIYACGPTVYGRMHIGNLRTYIFVDTLRRILTVSGLDVTHVMNITDVGHLTDDGDQGEEKMIVAMRREGKTAWEIADFYTDLFLKDMEKLHVLRPDKMPKATEHIEDQIKMIELLEKNGHTYQISDGIYFDTSTLDSYGELSGQSLEDKEAGAGHRATKNEEKRHGTDFALWKFSPEGYQRDMEWESPWGKGFPGWHIECSAMSEKYLGSPFDIHTGGIDHIPVHHENEIAQAKGSLGNALANIWMHAAFLKVDGGKMGKSLGNMYSLDDILEKGFSPLDFRYFMFTAHYKTALDFTWENLEAAKTAFDRLKGILNNLPKPMDENQSQEYLEKFNERVSDDLDMPGALAILWNLVKDQSVSDEVKSATAVKFDRILGLGLENEINKQIQIPEEVSELLKKREEARKNADWELSDQLRDQIQQKGYIVEDKETGQTIREK